MSTLTTSYDSLPRTKMKRNYLGHAFPSPFMLWGDLATKTLEMMLASAQVIGPVGGRWVLAGLLLDWTSHGIVEPLPHTEARLPHRGIRLKRRFHEFVRPLPSTVTGW